MTKNRYLTFSRKTLAKTGEVKPRAKFATREAAREWKRSQESIRNWGIYDVVTGKAVR